MATSLIPDSYVGVDYKVERITVATGASVSSTTSLQKTYVIPADANGYRPVAIVGFQIEGNNYHRCLITRLYLDTTNNTIYFRISAFGGGLSSGTFYADVLYVKP